MLVLFGSLRVLQAVCYGLDVVFAYWLWMRGVSDTVCLIILLAVVVLLMLIFRLAAVLKHQKLVNILYKQLDPEQFIAAYEPLLQKAAGRPRLECTVRNYLSTGYAAKGDFEMAIRLLEESPQVSGKQAVRGQALRLGNLCSIYLQMNETAKAEETLHRLENLLARDKENRAGDDMRATVVTLRNYVQAARGWNADEAFLRRMALRTTEPYHQVVNRYELALAQLGAHKRPQARENLRQVAEQGKTLYVGREAARRLALLDKKNGEEPEESAPGPSADSGDSAKA